MEKRETTPITTSCTQGTLGTSVVKLPIRKPEHIDFIRELFQGERGKPIKITRNEFIGRFIFSLRCYSDKPVQQKIPEGMNAVEIEFPSVEWSSHFKHYSYFPVEHVMQINDFISSCFDLYFHIYFFDTAEIEDLSTDDELSQIEITKQMLVDSFVSGLDMLDFSKASETIKKREYRRSVREMMLKQKKFILKDYRFRKKIYNMRRKYIKSILFQYDIKK